MVLIDHVDNLISNINSVNIPSKMDLILDGGLFNGLYQLGGLLYLKQLENKNKISVKRISGTSIGSFMGLMYILNKLDTIVEISDELVQGVRKTLNLTKFKNILNVILLEHMNENDYKLANHRLYISYFNNKTKKQIIKNKYKSNSDLIEQIIKSTHIPFLTDGNIEHNNSVDGVTPYIFKKCNRKILFLKLTSHSQLNTMVNIKHEINVYGRILEGIIDIHKFFTTSKKTVMCSYIDDWTIFDFGYLRLREISWIIILVMLDILLFINNKIPNVISESIHFIRTKRVFINFYKDVFSHVFT